MTGLGVVGFLDDYIKISKQRSLGLRAGAKLAGQTFVAITFAVLALQFPNQASYTPGVAADLGDPGHRRSTSASPGPAVGPCCSCSGRCS